MGPLCHLATTKAVNKFSNTSINWQVGNVLTNLKPDLIHQSHGSVTKLLELIEMEYNLLRNIDGEYAVNFLVHYILDSLSVTQTTPCYHGKVDNKVDLACDLVKNKLLSCKSIFKLEVSSWEEWVDSWRVRKDCLTKSNRPIIEEVKNQWVIFPNQVSGYCRITIYNAVVLSVSLLKLIEKERKANKYFKQ